MNISLNWLNDYLKTGLPVEEICKILTSIGLEVGGYENSNPSKEDSKAWSSGK